MAQTTADPVGLCLEAGDYMGAHPVFS